MVTQGSSYGVTSNSNEQLQDVLDGITGRDSDLSGIPFDVFPDGFEGDRIYIRQGHQRHHINRVEQWRGQEEEWDREEEEEEWNTNMNSGQRGPIRVTPGTPRCGRRRAVGSPHSGSTSSPGSITSILSRGDNAVSDGLGLQFSAVEEEEEAEEEVMTMPSKERCHLIGRYLAEMAVDTRAKGTRKLYGNLRMPKNSRGYIGGFARWCMAGPNELVDGVLTDPGKEPYAIIATMDLCKQYIAMNFLRRKLYNQKEKEYNIDKMHSKSGLDNCIKALKGLYDLQASKHPSGLQGFQNEYGCRPNSLNELTMLKLNHSRKLPEERRKKHLPRGKGALVMQGYTKAQNQQLFTFGLTNEWKHREFATAEHARLYRNFGADKMWSTRTQHALVHNYMLRFDDRWKILISQFCVVDAPDVFSGQKMLGLVMDWRKTVQDGAFEAVYALRHVSNPERCTFFAVMFELFCQVHLTGLGFTVEDFMPVPLEDGNYYHRWYNRFLFTGNTKCKAGQASVPNAYLHCCYEAVKNGFVKLYQLVTPEIKSYHKLHLQRGVSARMAELAGCDAHQIGNHGGWKRNGVLFNNYLNGVPMDFVKWIAGYSLQDVTVDYPDVKRNCVQPAQELVDKMFPFVKEVRESMKADFEANGGRYVQWYGHDDTLNGFLDLCTFGAVYLLQDLAIMYDRMSLHEVFSLPMLASVEFIEFRDQLMVEMNKLPDAQPQVRAVPEKHPVGD